MLVKEVIRLENACCSLSHPRQSAEETRKILEPAALALVPGKVNPALQKAAAKEEKRADFL